MEEKRDMWFWLFSSVLVIPRHFITVHSITQSIHDCDNHIHSLSINTHHRSIQWLMSYTMSNNSSPFSLIIRMIRTQFKHNHDNEYNRFKREGFMMEHSSDPTDQLSLPYHHSSLSTEWTDLNNPSLTIPLVSLIHPLLSLVMKNRLLFVSIHTNLCPTNSLHSSESDWDKCDHEQ